MIPDKQQLLTENIDTIIIPSVQNTLALLTIFFSESIDCWHRTYTIGFMIVGMKQT